MTEKQEDINAIISRGMAMKDRGEKFFEAGSREMGTYGKMIVRDLGNVRIPVMFSRQAPSLPFVCVLLPPLVWRGW